MLPVGSFVQYALPLSFFNILNGSFLDRPVNFTSAVQSLIWLAACGPLWLASLFVGLFKTKNTTFRRICIYSILLFAAFAFVTAGTEPRYVMPMSCLMIVSISALFCEALTRPEVYALTRQLIFAYYGAGCIAMFLFLFSKGLF
jgi:hypothetical protein